MQLFASTSHLNRCFATHILPMLLLFWFVPHPQAITSLVHKCRNFTETNLMIIASFVICLFVYLFFVFVVFPFLSRFKRRRKFTKCRYFLFMYCALVLQNFAMMLAEFRNKRQMNGIWEITRSKVSKVPANRMSYFPFLDMKMGIMLCVYLYLCIVYFYVYI